MRYRALDLRNDYSFGASQADFLINSPRAVAQAVATRLLLNQGEWFLNSQEGTPWFTDVLGTGTAARYDQAIRRRILGTQGVKSITAYSSVRVGRRLTVTTMVDTIYGVVNIATTLGGG